MPIEPEEGTPIIVSAQTDRACDAYIRMLDLEKQREEANASALDVDVAASSGWPPRKGKYYYASSE